jgi:hypothetical protein
MKDILARREDHMWIDLLKVNDLWEVIVFNNIAIYL